MGFIELFWIKYIRRMEYIELILYFFKFLISNACLRWKPLSLYNATFKLWISNYFWPAFKNWGSSKNFKLNFFLICTYICIIFKKRPWSWVWIKNKQLQRSKPLRIYWTWKHKEKNKIQNVLYELFHSLWICKSFEIKD